MNRLALGLVSAAMLSLTMACAHIEQHVKENFPTNSSSPSPAKPDEFAAVRTMYAKDCTLCHGEKGDGGPVKLDDGTKLKVPSLREGHALRHPDSDFVKQISKGGDGMPAFGEKLKTEEINDLIKFIRHDFQAGVTPPAEPAKK